MPQALASIGSSQPTRLGPSWPALIRTPPTRHNLCAEVLNRVHFENRGSVRPQPGNAPATRHSGPEPADYGFQSGRGLRPRLGITDWTEGDSGLGAEAVVSRDDRPRADP